MEVFSLREGRESFQRHRWDFDYTPPVISGHRRWRLYFTAGESFHVGVSELEFRVGGINIATGGTASASSTWHDLSPANAFDGSSGTDWASGPGGGIPGWLAYDLGVGNAADVDSVMIRARSYTTQGPKGFNVQYSDDGLTWVDALVVTNQPTWGSGEARVFPIV